MNQIDLDIMVGFEYFHSVLNMSIIELESRFHFTAQHTLIMDSPIKAIFCTQTYHVYIQLPFIVKSTMFHN